MDFVSLTIYNFFQMIQAAFLAVLLIQINHADQFQRTLAFPKIPPDSNNLTKDNPDAIYVVDDMIPFEGNEYDNPESEMEGGMNTTICSDLSGGDLCRLWLQGVLLFVVGLFGIVGNSVSFWKNYFN